MAKTPKDEVFKEAKSGAEDFKFGPKVAQVFDDMVSRSVPFYGEIQRMTSEIAADFATPNSIIYDLGCATGTTLIGLNSTIDESIKFVGIDESKEMLKKCQENLEIAGFTRPFDLRAENLNHHIDLENASVVVLCLTLQFIRPLYRERLIQDIYDQMNDSGCLILVEKVLGEDSLFNRLFISGH